ncbi:MAG: hypothetical protein ACC669_02115 [bacterium]
MLTGYNTNIKHEGAVYHIQTEDGGIDNPVIVSLIYQGGRILSSKKTSYAQIVGTEGFVSQLRLLIEDQHRNMINTVTSGKFSDDAVPAPSPSEPIPDTADEKNLDQVILEYLASELDGE